MNATILEALVDLLTEAGWHADYADDSTLDVIVDDWKFELSITDPEVVS